VHVDQHRATGRGQAGVDAVGHCRGVRLEPRSNEFGVARGIVLSKWVTLRGARIDGTHAHRAHLLPLVGKAFGVDDEPGQPVDEPPGAHSRPVGDLCGQFCGARVGHALELRGQLGVGEQQVRANRPGHVHRGVRDMKEYRRVVRAVVQSPATSLRLHAIEQLRHRGPHPLVPWCVQPTDHLGVNLRPENSTLLP
jgi:hypothetical protein